MLSHSVYTFSQKNISSNSEQTYNTKLYDRESSNENNFATVVATLSYVIVMSKKNI